MSDKTELDSSRSHRPKPADRLAWLLSFAQRSPASIRELSGHRLELIQREIWNFPRQVFAKGAGDWSDLTADRIAALAGEMAGVINSLSRHEPSAVTIEGALIKLYIDPTFRNSKPRYITDRITAFKLEAAELLAAEGHRVRRCAWCQKLFVRKKGHSTAALFVHDGNVSGDSRRGMGVRSLASGGICGM